MLWRAVSAERRWQCHIMKPEASRGFTNNCYREKWITQEGSILTLIGRVRIRKGELPFWKKIHITMAFGKEIWQTQKWIHNTAVFCLTGFKIKASGISKLGMPLPPSCWSTMHVHILKGLRSPGESKVREKYDCMVSRRETGLSLRQRLNRLLANRSLKIVQGRNWKTPWSTGVWPKRTRAQDLRWGARSNKNVPKGSRGLCRTCL